MKKFLFPLVVLSAFFFVSCDSGSDEPEEPEMTEEEKAHQAQLATVPEAQMNLFIKHTGTKCPPCGSWGWQCAETAIERFKDRAIVITAYGDYGGLSESFISQHATQLGTADAVSGIPSFHANGKKCATSGSASDAWVSSTLDAAEIEFTLTEENSLVANAALNWKVENNRATGTYRVRFFKETSGEYVASVWFDESGMEAAQSGYTAGIPAHHHVLRTCATDNVYGEKLGEGGTIAKDAIFNVDFDIEFPTSVWNVDNTNATVVIWRKIGNTHVFVNASQTTF